ncbi:MAG: hypothetical protein H7288_12440 [Kineosporiaceae bacterium]|nr:hypothetical protein [Aeromicrobium sp.]
MPSSGRESLLAPGPTGLARAIQRYDAAKASAAHDRDDLLIPCLEALWWARALDEHLDAGDYRARRDANEAGRVLGGIRWARNRGNHDFTPVLEWQDGLTWPATWPVNWGDYKWVSTEDLAVTGRSGKDRPGMQAYTAHPSGQPVQNALYQTEIWLRSEAQSHSPRA